MYFIQAKLESSLIFHMLINRVVVNPIRAHNTQQREPEARPQMPPRLVWQCFPSLIAALWQATTEGDSEFVFGSHDIAEPQ